MAQKKSTILLRENIMQSGNERPLQEKRGRLSVPIKASLWQNL